MATTTPQDEYDDWAPAARVAARPELWALIAPHLNLVEAFRLKTVYRAAREGATEGLRTLSALM
jgi:hypothetical protein